MNQKSTNNGLAILRIVTGLLVMYHGLEIFNSETMNSYLQWEKIKVLPFPVVMTYLGKGIELIGGIGLAIGLFTRISALLITLDMLFICFYIGSGKFYYEDQHPFLFANLAMVYFFAGPIRYAFDKIIFKNKSNE